MLPLYFLYIFSIFSAEGGVSPPRPSLPASRLRECPRCGHGNPTTAAECYGKRKLPTPSPNSTPRAPSPKHKCIYPPTQSPTSTQQKDTTPPPHQLLPKRNLAVGNHSAGGMRLGFLHEEVFDVNAGEETALYEGPRRAQPGCECLALI